MQYCLYLFLENIVQHNIRMTLSCASRMISMASSSTVQVSPEGKVLRYMADPQGSVIQSVTSVVETKEGLYFGNLHGNTISFLRRSNFSPILD